MMSVAEVSDSLCKAGEEQFTETGPRPTTLPGQEQDATFTDDIEAKLKSALKLPTGYHDFHMSERAVVSSLAHSPFKPHLHGVRRSHHSMQTVREKDFKNDPDGDPPLGYEPEGSEGTTPPSEPPCLKWAKTLRNLLRDVEGVELFKCYLKQEGCEDSLNFWFACEGLKKTPPDDLGHLQQLIKAIYRKYIRSHNAIQIGTSTRKVITEKVVGKSSTDMCIFDGAQREVEHAISMSTYVNFLKSEIYLQHVRSMQNGPGYELSPKHGDGSTSASASCSLPSSGSSSSSGRLDTGGPLQTVLEDSELNVCTATTTLPLTSKHLMVTQRHRASYSDARKPEAYAGVYLQQALHSRSANPYHAMYGTRIPGSAQDSELQSLSSDAHTDDTISLTDSSLDGASTTRNTSRKYLKQQHRAMRQNANQNKDPLNQVLIPRTQRLPLEHIISNEPEAFAATLIAKLEAVRRSQESQERVDESLRKLEHEDIKCHNVKLEDRGHGPNPLTTVLSAMKTLALGDENDQSILDEHCSRVWNDSAHQTPSRSPGHHSPPLRPHSPERRRASAPILANPYATKSTYINAHLHHRHRKERDVASMFSNDSGAVPDFVDSEGSLSTGAAAGGSAGTGGPPFYHKHGHHHSTKSKGPGDGFDMSRGNLVDPYSATAGDLQRRSRDVGKRSSGKKSFLDSSSSGIDSGVSLAYEPNSQPPSNFTREKVMSWVLENEKYSSSHPSDSEKDSSSRHKKSSYSTLSTTSPGPNRSGRGKKPVTYNASRSGSLERGGHIPRSNPLPQQPFMTDPSMPILPPPNTTTQLEEARRRLEDDTKNKLAKSKSGALGKDRMLYQDLDKGNRVNQSKMSLSGISLEAADDGAMIPKKTSKKLSSANPLTATAPSSSTEGDFTIVGYHFVGESVPYRSKLAGKNIVLKQFKSLITKKGNFRYFFKSESDDFGTGIVYEEVSEDNDVLPLWEGKIFARLESID